MNLRTVGLLNYQLRFLMLQKAEMVIKIKKKNVEIIVGIFFKENRCLILKYCSADGFKM